MVSLEQYHLLIEKGALDSNKVELVNGVIVHKWPRTNLHILIVDILLEMLESFCPKSEYWVRQELPLTIGNSEPEPDISVVKGSRSELRKQKPVTAQFVVEVAVSSLAIDRAKGDDYAAANIPEYWIVRPKAKKIEVYRAPVDGKYSSVQEIAADTVIESVALPGFSLKLADHL